MKIAIFSDTYFPIINGVGVSIENLKLALEELGHIVYLVTPYEVYGSNFTVPSIRIKSKIEYSLALPYFFEIFKALKKLDIDIIHAHSDFSLRIFAYIVSRKLKVPLVASFHNLYEYFIHYLFGNHFKWFQINLVLLFNRKICRYCDYLVVPTKDIDTYLENKNIFKKRYIIPTGIDVKKFIDKETLMKEKDLRFNIK